MNLVIDKGNTATKIALFDADRLVSIERVPDLTISHLQTILHQYPVTRVALSTVSSIHPDTMRYLQTLPGFLNLTADTPTPICNPFPTLGPDRLAAVVGAYSLHHDSDFIVIDMGTCITYEIVINHEYIGGNILPGLMLRLRSLHQNTHLLPQIPPRPFADLYGTDTETAILAGVMGGIQHEIEGFITAMQEKYGNFSIFLTGGDSKYFENQIKIRNFAVENLVLIGLNYLLNQNE